MRCFLVLAGFCVLAAGCDNSNGNPKDDKDVAGIYEAVLKVELKDAKKGAGHFLFIDGKDPAPELLKRFQKQWPELQPGSKVPKNDRATRINLGELKWVDRNSAELRGGFSNGIDGRGSKYHLVRKKNEWVIEKAVVEVES